MLRKYSGGAEINTSTKQQQQKTREEILENLETMASSVVIQCNLASRDRVSDQDAASIFWTMCEGRGIAWVTYVGCKEFRFKEEEGRQNPLALIGTVNVIFFR
jgi:hypothetical protein